MIEPLNGDEPWLDAALARALVPPQLPGPFRQQLRRALADAESQKQGAAQALAQAEREQRDRMAQLEADYVRLRRRTLGTLIGGSFAAGAVVAVAMPWLQVRFGVHTPLVLASCGAVAAFFIALRSWRPRDLLADLG
jgi:hypothetical protein